VTAKTLFSFFVPGSFVFVAAVILIQAKVLAPWLPQIVRIAPGAVLIAGILLGWRFNRSRLVFALLMLAIADRSLVHFTDGTAPGTTSGRFIFNAVAVLLPLNLALLSLLKERGIATLHGALRACLILAQPLAVAVICHYRWFALNVTLDTPIIKASLLRHLPALPLPQPALIAAAIAFLLSAWGFTRRRGAIESGFLWALPTVCMGLAARDPGLVTTFYFCVAGFLLVVSVVEASYAMAFRDELTDLPARRSLNEFLLKMGNHYTVAMVDIDFFKKFNDTYGHDVGDQVLRMVASKLSKVTGGGRAFRYGGEEFAVIFPGKDVDEAILHLEQLRMTIKATGFFVRGRSRPRRKPDRPDPPRGPQKRVSVSVSIGVAERSVEHASAQDVVKTADKALYRAKKAGRNRVST
jgi:GGDEF domain-containing protein